MQISILAIVLIFIAFLVILYLTYKLASYKTNLKWQKNLVSLRGDIADKQRVVLKGRLAETFAPFLKGFPFKPSECKFLGDPVDYIVFEGLDDRHITGIHFVEVKSGNAKLSKHQQHIKDILDTSGSDNITFKEFRFED
jgi:predicted Holliday junction resolvase-like endonuclease